MYLERGSGVDRRELDRIAQDIAKSRPTRLTVVAEREQADVVLAVAITTTDGGTMVAPIGGTVFAIPLSDAVAHLTVRSATDGHVLWDDSKRGNGVRDLVKALLKRLAESGPPPSLAIVKREPVTPTARPEQLPTSALLSPMLGLHNPGALTCSRWHEVRSAAAAAESAVEAGRPLDPGPPDPATLYLADRIMVVTVTAWLQGHVQGAFNLGFWFSMNGLVDERTKEATRAGFDAQLRMPGPEAIAPWFDTFCATHPDESVGAAAVRWLREAYVFRVKEDPPPETPTDRR